MSYTLEELKYIRKSLTSVLNDYKNKTNKVFFICNALKSKAKISENNEELLLSYMAANKPSFTVHTKFYNSKEFKGRTNFNSAWWDMYDVKSRLKFLRYLIRNLTKQIKDYDTNRNIT